MRSVCCACALRALTVSLRSDTRVDADRVDAPLAAYVCELLAGLPYGTSDEPLHVIHAVNRLVSLMGRFFGARARARRVC